MSLREEMHNLVEGIASASETRRAGLLPLPGEVASQLHESHQAHGRMARELRAGLAKGEAQRISEFQHWIGEITSDRVAAQAEWRSRSVALHGRTSGGPARSNASDQGSGSPAQTSGEAAASGHRARASRR